MSQPDGRIAFGPDKDRLDSIMRSLLTVSNCWAKICRVPAKWGHSCTA